MLRTFVIFQKQIIWENFMKTFRLATSFSVIALLLAACSDSGSSSGGSNSGPNPIDKIEVGACENIEDPTLNAQVVEATDSLVRFVFGIAEAPEDLEALQNSAEKAKAIFKKALDRYPNSCDAQLGLAAAQIADIVNNKDVGVIYNAFANGSEDEKASLFNIRKNYAESALSAAVRAKDLGDKLITDRVQEIIAGKALPSIDSAIYLLNNIRQSKDYAFSYEMENLEIYLGQGELALSVGTLNALKAFLTVVASFNLDASSDRSYDWLVTSIDWNDSYVRDTVLTAEQKAALKHYASLFEKTSPFLSVKDSWKSAYKSVPDILDSAIENLKESYAYLLGQAESGNASSLSPFVGNSEEADFYTEEIEKTLEILDSVQRVLHGTMTVYHDGEEIQIDVRKFFDMTDGFQKYLPYHKLNPVDSWMESLTDPKPKYISWITAEEYESRYSLYAENAVVEAAKTQLNLPITSGEFSFYVMDRIFLYHGDECMANASLEWNGCEFSIQKNVFLDEPSAWISLDSSICKVENGTAKFKAVNADLLANPFNFTDKDGNVTSSFSDFDQDVLMLKRNDAEKEEFVALIERTVIFPDPTFQGVLPGMNQHRLSVILAGLI